MAEGTRDQRRYPRIDLSKSGARCIIDAGYGEFSVCDVSRGGISFFSNHRFDSGRRMRLNVEYIFGTEIEVVHCDMFITDEMFLEAKYRIGAKFIGGDLDQELFTLLLRTFKV